MLDTHCDEELFSVISFPTPGSSRSLADASPGDLVEVDVIAFDFVRTACWHLSIRPGETLQCLDRRPDSVLAARSNGVRVCVPHDCARFIGTRRIKGHLDDLPPDLLDGAQAPETPRSAQ